MEHIRQRNGQEINNTREDVLKPFEEYQSAFPVPRQALVG